MKPYITTEDKKAAIAKVLGVEELQVDERGRIVIQFGKGAKMGRPKGSAKEREILVKFQANPELLKLTNNALRGELGANWQTIQSAREAYEKSLQKVLD